MRYQCLVFQIKIIQLWIQTDPESQHYLSFSHMCHAEINSILLMKFFMTPWNDSSGIDSPIVFVMELIFIARDGFSPMHQIDL